MRRELERLIKGNLRCFLVFALLSASAVGFFWQYFERQSARLAEREAAIGARELALEKTRIQVVADEARLQEQMAAFAARERDLAARDKALGAREKTTTPATRLQKHVELYLAKYAHIDLGKTNRCDRKYMDDYRRASSTLDLIETLAREAGKDEVYREFVQRRRGTGAVIDVGECSSS